MARHKRRRRRRKTNGKAGRQTRSRARFATLHWGSGVQGIKERAGEKEEIGSGNERELIVH